MLSLCVLASSTGLSLAQGTNLSCQADWFVSYCGVNVATAVMALNDAGNKSAADKIEADWQAILDAAGIHAISDPNSEAMKKGLADYSVDTVKKCLGRTDAGAQQIMEEAPGCDEPAVSAPASAGPLDLFRAEQWTELRGFDPSILPEAAFAGRKRGDTTHYEGRQFDFMAKDDSALIRVMDPDWGHVQLFFLVDDQSSVWWLDGHSAPLWQYLAKHKPVLETELQARQMLYLMMFFIQGEEGPFAIVESTDDYLFPGVMRSDFTDITSKIGAHLKPARCSRLEGAAWSCIGNVYYSNAVFDATVKLEAGGIPKIAGDVPAFTDLPAKIDIPIRFGTESRASESTVAGAAASSEDASDPGYVRTESTEWNDENSRSYALEIKANVIGPGRRAWAKYTGMSGFSSPAGWPKPRVLAPGERVEDLKRPFEHERAIELFHDLSAPNFWMAVYNRVSLNNSAPLKPGVYYLTGIIDGWNKAGCSFNRDRMTAAMSARANKSYQDMGNMVIDFISPGGNLNVTGTMVNSVVAGSRDGYTAATRVGCDSAEFKRLDDNFAYYLVTN